MAQDDFDVRLTDITKRFGDAVAVDNISLSVRRGEFFSLLGPSGCGKTTTLRMIAGFEHPTSGELRIRDRVVNNVPAFKRETNLVFQQLALFPHMDVFDNVAFGLRIKKLGKQEIRTRVMRMLDVVQLEGFDRRRVGQLSGGQQQRVAIARSLVNEPAVLLLDEPLGALDLKLRLQMQLELKALQQRLGTTFIYVTHDQSEALTMSDRIAVMNRGKVEQVDAGREIYLRPKTAFVARFIGETNLIRGIVRSCGSGEAVIEIQGLSLRIRTSLPLNEREEVDVSIRPETLQLQSRAEDATHHNGAANAFPARVTGVTFFGSTLRYQMTLPSGLVVDAQRLAGDATIFAVGDEVIVSVRPDGPVVLRDADGAGA
ncbi:MAG: spermidine/putrescine transport system ATP-binding protein [Thermomicrobiales bacterium]|nr:spermidine/putrescine transport system ATP-binding protein [Thermomicrobiales bacterium]